MFAMFEHMIWMYFHVPQSSYWQCKYLLVYAFVTKPNHIKKYIQIHHPICSPNEITPKTSK